MPSKNALQSYCSLMHAFARMTTLDVARYQVHRMGQAAPVHKALLKAERSTPQHTLETLTEPAPKSAAPRRFKQ